MKRKLFSVTIKDCKVDYFRCGGNGGQNVNKVETGVRITHEPSGASAKSCDTRHQHQNKVIAFKRMAEHPKFKSWLRVEASRRLGLPTIEEIVEEQMKSQNIKTEIQDSNGRWINGLPVF